MKQENCYISCNCNQTPTAAHWGKNNLICYASCNAIMIYDPKLGSGGKVISSLAAHSKRVNSVRWITGSIERETELVSGSTDNNAIVWSLRGDTHSYFTLNGHTSHVNIVDGLYKGPGRNQAIVATVSMDCTVKLWFRPQETDDFTSIQTIDFGYSICVGLRLSNFLQNEGVILACAPDNSSIILYVDKTDTEVPKFEQSVCLKGHEDWVRGLDFTSDNEDILLASSSQDSYIRLWRITPIKSLDSLEFSDDVIIEGRNRKFSVSVDSILTGHEGWIYSVNWSPNKLQLLSSSLDKTMIIWELDKESGLWLEKIRVGEVGGNTLGFYGGFFGPEGDRIFAHSYHGAFHIWIQNKDSDRWEPGVTVGGHFGPVMDLAWDPREGEFLVSVSTDQTTRIHAPWPKSGEYTVTWHEIGRPQVHGYDLSSLALISRWKFASSAEEKVIRTFQAPVNFIQNFKRICKISGDDDFVNNCEPRGASVPSLGLSNKAVFSSNNDESVKNCKNSYEALESHFVALELEAPPTEETLLQNTLWPEIQKLYGHGYEVYSLASSPDGAWLASACKATTSEHAAIFLWDTSSWRMVQKLTSHTLTVAQMSFSPNSRHLLSVSRDRRWSLFSRSQLTNEFELVATTDKKTSIHTRIIWCCTWSHDSSFFATGSRDGKVVAWTRSVGKNEKGSVLGEYGSVNHLDLKGESVTCLAFAPDRISNSYLIAVGLESGLVHLYKWDSGGWTPTLTLDKTLAHHLTVKKLAFRPIFGRAGYDDNRDCRNILQLASCSIDNSVRIHNIFINKYEA